MASLGAAAAMGLALSACITAQPAYGVPDTGEEEDMSSSGSESDTGETGETGEDQDAEGGSESGTDSEG